MGLNRETIGAVFLVLLFSLICFIAVDYNNTKDFSYVTYFVSFAVWLFSAYTVCSWIRTAHNRIDLPLLVIYLAIVCAIQCVLALMIDYVLDFQLFVDSYVEQGQETIQRVRRLYGIGASLDNAGVRFAVVLVLIAAVLAKDQETRSSHAKILFLTICFFTIAIIGNMISRTTFIGAVMALLYLMVNTGLFRMEIRPEHFKFYFIFGGMMSVAILLTTYFYNTDEVFRQQIRFGFEGFFNLIEEGKWRTDSTDKLNRTMWVWPETGDTKSWLIGTGLFDNWVYDTDIGYCRFILYCGLIGFIPFALFFVYHAVVFALKYKKYWDVFFLFLALTFIVWIKVSTDIFFIYALLYAMGYFIKPANELEESGLLAVVSEQ